ncbi:MAG: sigma-70 family RNA polymerase sigma factor [Chloroflexi bacterium]|nr:sigma-70 family RNA polymerase sigma factor [Chloroflexota bacterium]
MTVESRLLKEAQAFNQQALAEIYDQYNQDLFRYAMRSLGNQNSAEECVAETFSRFLQALRRGKGPRQHLRAYLYRTAHNWITDQYRRQPPPDVPLEEETWVANDAGLLQSVAEKQNQARVRWALAQLTPDQQQVIMLKFYEGWKNRDVAQVLDKPVGAVKSLQHRALAALERLLAPVEEVKR